MAVAVRLEYNVNIWKEGDLYVAQALPLNVMSCGSSPQKARRNLDEAIGVFLKTAADQSNLEEILTEAGYRRTDDVWHPPEMVTSEYTELAVPV
jgi:predicted RNase H-like HicB family nuclease